MSRSGEDSMEFEPQNDLERSLMRAIVDPARRPQFERDFLESDVYFLQAGPLPATADILPTRTELPNGFVLQIEPIEFDGQSYLPIYASLYRLQETLDTRELGNYIALNESVERDALVIPRSSGRPEVACPPPRRSGTPCP
jgi:hypothetical protein